MTTPKYALEERERRFLVAELPSDEPWATRSIADLYIEGSRVRLRRNEGIVNGQPELVFKLTQKVPSPNGVLGHRGYLTTMYLDAAEYEIFRVLSGDWLDKTRLSFPPMGVDVFGGPLAGLMIAEAEFDDDDAMSAFVPPTWCGREITDVPSMTGANLARISKLPPIEAAAALGDALVGTPNCDSFEKGHTATDVSS